MLNLKVIHATTNCADSTCPTIYQNENGEYVIQGFKMKPQDKSQIPIPENEDAIILPQEFLESFLAKQN